MGTDAHTTSSMISGKLCTLAQTTSSAQFSITPSKVYVSHSMATVRSNNQSYETTCTASLGLRLRYKMDLKISPSDACVCRSGCSQSQATAEETSMITLPYAFRDEYIGMVQVAQFKRAALTACSCEKLLIMTRHPVIVFSFCSAKGANSDSSISCSHSVGCSWDVVRMMPLRDAF